MFGKLVQERVDLPVNAVRLRHDNNSHAACVVGLNASGSADISAEQSRIRSNMSALGRDAKLYQRYVGKLTVQEDHFDRGLKAISQTRTKCAEMQRELAKYFPSSKDDKADIDPLSAARYPARGNWPD